MKPEQELKGLREQYEPPLLLEVEKPRGLTGGCIAGCCAGALPKEIATRRTLA